MEIKNKRVKVLNKKSDNTASPLSLVIITFTVIMTFWSSLTGKMFWPFFSYPMYSVSSEKINEYSLLAEDDKGHLHPVVDTYILWPVGPNGISYKIKSLFYLQASETEIDSILEYFYTRYLLVKEKKFLPHITKIHILHWNGRSKDIVFTYQKKYEH